MSDKVKLVGKLAGDDDLQGLDSMADELLDNPEQVQVAVIHFDVSKIVEDTDEHNRVPYVRIRRFEPVGDVDNAPDELQRIVTQAVEDRTGKAPLPFDAVDGIEVE